MKNIKLLSFFAGAVLCIVFFYYWNKTEEANPQPNAYASDKLITNEKSHIALSTSEEKNSDCDGCLEKLDSEITTESESKSSILKNEDLPRIKADQLAALLNGGSSYSTLEKNFESEAVDPEWSSNKLSDIHKAFESDYAIDEFSKAGIVVDSAECKSSTCKISVFLSDPTVEGNAIRKMAAISKVLFKTSGESIYGMKTSASRVADDNIVMYLGRKE